jgi:hypothetical protein
MSKAVAVEIADLLPSRELGQEIFFEEIEGRLAPMGWYCCEPVDDRGRGQLCCGTRDR